MIAAAQHVAARDRCRSLVCQNATHYYAALAHDQQKFIGYIANIVWHRTCDWFSWPDWIILSIGRRNDQEGDI